MEEIIDPSRKMRKILISPKHFFERAMGKKLFSSPGKAESFVIKAIKNHGVLIEPLMREENVYWCMFKSDLGILVCCPITLVGSSFLVKTVWPVEDSLCKQAYKEIIRKRRARLSKLKYLPLLSLFF